VSHDPDHAHFCHAGRRRWPFGEIAAELFLSPHTIKTQARSIYRKLGASTRSQAVTRARQLGLLDG
jgi:LuxR family maltose regulon positive regulatory protein